MKSRFGPKTATPMPDRRTGTIFVRGPSVMSGYYNEPEITAQTLSQDGWLNTGDIGYRIGKELIITGRKKDLIIINGRNIWPQDLEYLAEANNQKFSTGDALAFSAPDAGGDETTVLVVQCRLRDTERTQPACRAAATTRPRRAGHRLQSGTGSGTHAAADVLRQAFTLQGSPELY